MNNPIREAMIALPGHWGKLSVGVTELSTTCGLGHVRRASRETGLDFRKAADFMEETAKELYPDRVHFQTLGDSAFGNFNDHPDTTEEEVLHVMEKAAIKFDEQAGL